MLIGRTRRISGLVVRILVTLLLGASCVLAFEAQVLAAEADANASSADLAQADDAESTRETPAKEVAATPNERSLAERPGLLFVSFGPRNDLGHFSRHRRTGPYEINREDEVSAWGPQLEVGYLTRIGTNWRVGGALGYGFNYDTNNEDSLLGQLLTADVRLEWSAPVAGKWWLLAGPRAGLSSIIPGGILQDRIEESQREGYGAVSGPRLGFLVGGDIGMRYQASNWFSLKGTLGYVYTMNFLLDSGASAGGVVSEQSWQTSTSRLSALLGAELAF